VFTIFLYNNLCRLSNEHNAAKHHWACLEK
jgi:hypothetical protein